MAASGYRTTNPGAFPGLFKDRDEQTGAVAANRLPGFANVVML
jgi:hypothetical protein